MSAPDNRELVPPLLVNGVIAAMREVADEVIVPRFRQLAAHQIKSKTRPGDVVTIADEESERALGPRLNALLAGSRVIGEEAAFADPTLFDLLQGHDPVWIIDPIDGTANFVNGVAAFAVIIALVHDGETRMGWIYEPLEGRTLWAAKGKGAWRTGPAALNAEMDHQRVRIPPTGDDLKEMVAAMHNKDLGVLRGKFGRNIRLGSAAHDYWALAEGRSHVLAYRKLKPWDHAAGLLIHEEAGGYNRLLSGDRYNPTIRDQMGVLCAPTEAIWQKIKEMVKTVEYPRQLPLFGTKP
jgi:fructose-1,6-bisphosphatase/inositol monophosphatase family enzyme